MSADIVAADEGGLDDPALVAAIRTGSLQASLLRAELLSRERRAAAEETVATTRDPREAWSRLGGPAADMSRLFHVRRGSTVGAPTRLVREMRAGAARMALCASPGVPPAPCAAWPVSVGDAILFSLFAPVLGHAEALLVGATRALDRLGSGTHALSRIPQRDAGRTLVWSTVDPDHRRIVCRTTRLLTVHLLAQLGDGAWWRPVGRGDVAHVADGTEIQRLLPNLHYCEWSQLVVIAAGALAWRAAVLAGLRVAATDPRPGSRLYVRSDSVGRRYADLENPFEPLLQLRRLGVVLQGYSTSAISAGVQRQRA